MSYDEELAERLRTVVAARSDVTEKRMFGGLAFLLNGHMFCGIIKEDLMVRVGPQKYETALLKPHARPMDFTGRPLNGYVYVAPAGYLRTETLKQWVLRSLDFVSTLPAKQPPVEKSRRARPMR